MRFFFSPTLFFNGNIKVEVFLSNLIVLFDGDEDTVLPSSDFDDDDGDNRNPWSSLDETLMK